VTKAAFIEVRGLTYRYRHESSRPVLNHIDLAIDRKDYLLITGCSGSGKSTLCRALNGLVPHFYGGVLSGEVFVAGQPVSRLSIADLFDRVGLVFQNPDLQLFCRSVEQEIVFGLESAGLARPAIENRLDTVLADVGIDHLRHRDPQSLSGGEKHLVLVAALLAFRPEVIVLDEPFANLDPANVSRVRALLRKLHAAGCGIVVCEHRLSRAAPDATRMAVIHQGQIAAQGAPDEILKHIDPAWGLEAPLATRISATLDLDPLALAVEDLENLTPRPDLLEKLEPPLTETAANDNSSPALAVEHVDCHIAGRAILSDISFTVHPGECVAIVGANGAGKTTLLRHLIGLQRPTNGRVIINGRDSAHCATSDLAREVGLAFQNPDNQFFRFTVDQEIRVGPETLGRFDGAWIEELMKIFRLEAFRSKAPYRLSGGEKKRVAFASALASRPAVLALDEPTAGQDFEFRRNLRAFLRQMRALGQAVIIVTHDLTFAERTAGRWLLLADGRILADGPPEQVMTRADHIAQAGLEVTDRFHLARLWRKEDGHA